MWNVDECTWKPCIFSNQGHEHLRKTEYVWGKLLAEKHTEASINCIKIAFSSGALSIVNGHVVETAGGGDHDDSDAAGVSEDSAEDIWQPSL